LLIRLRAWRALVGDLLPTSCQQCTALVCFNATNQPEKPGCQPTRGFSVRLQRRLGPNDDQTLAGFWRFPHRCDFLHVAFASMFAVAALAALTAAFAARGGGVSGSFRFQRPKPKTSGPRRPAGAASAQRGASAAPRCAASPHRMRERIRPRGRSRRSCR
jgi:hypothetical protein